MVDDDPDEVPEFALISEARRHAAIAQMLLEHPKVKASNGESGSYVTALAHCELILHLVRTSEHCTDAEEFDGLLYSICCNAEGLARTLSQIRIP